MIDHAKALELADVALSYGPSLCCGKDGVAYMGFVAQIGDTKLAVDAEIINMAACPREFMAREIMEHFGDATPIPDHTFPYHRV